MKTVFSFTLLLSAALMIGCSSGGGESANDRSNNITFSGNTSQADINAGNVEAIGKTSGEAVLQADASSGIPAGLSVSTPTNLEHINSIVLSTAEALMLPAAVENSLNFCDTGSATISGISDQASGPVTYTMVFNNCTMKMSDDDGITSLNGAVVISHQDISDPNAGFTLIYNNFTVTGPYYGTTTINMVVDCTNLSNCTYSSDFVGSDGATHRVVDFNITGNANVGFNGSATFLHSFYGEVSINVTNITYGGSCGSIPNGGTISFNSTNGSSGIIMFNADCSVSGSWDDGNGNAGSF